jgi:hypothetical protein
LFMTLKKAWLAWYELPEAKPVDVRDAEEHRAIAEALSVLSAEHPARIAYAHGMGTIALTHLVADRRDIVATLTEAYLCGNRRALQRSGHFRP